MNPLSFFRNEPETNPQIRRERTLERRVALQSIIILVLIIGFIAYTIVLITYRQPPLVVDKVTGELIGEYRPKISRTTTEMIAGGIRFLKLHNNLNSDTVELDQETALDMMGAELRKKREKYLFDQNFIAQVKSWDISSLVEIDKTIIKDNEGDMKLEVIGRIIVTARSYKKDGSGEYQYKDEQKKPKPEEKPFHVYLDLVPVQISNKNSVGVRVDDYYDF